MANDPNTSEDQLQADEREARLGACLHTFMTKVRTSKSSKRALEISGGAGAVLVPVGLALVHGTMGIVLAVLGGLVATAAWFLSAREGKKRPSTKIEVFERGLVASHGDAAREILWNEVVDITTNNVPTTSGTPAVVLVFETVATPPLLIMVGGSFSSESETAKLLDSLRDVWMPIWCRRARVLAQQQDGLLLGLAHLTFDHVAVGGQTLAWSAVAGVQVVDGEDCLKTSDGSKPVESCEGTNPFPSTARRIAALAASPPTRPLLPPVPSKLLPKALPAAKPTTTRS